MVFLIKLNNLKVKQKTIMSNKKNYKLLLLLPVLIILYISYSYYGNKKKTLNKPNNLKSLSYSKSNHNAKIQSITEAESLGDFTFQNVILEWNGRGTQGGLIVSKGKLTDTIYDCTYGNFPDYKILKYDSNEYLFTTCLMNGAGFNRQSFYLWSLNNKNFMKQLFFKELYTGKEGVYDTKTGVLIGTDNININPTTPKIKNWIVDSLNEEVHWLMEKDYEFSIMKNKAIIIVDSTYSLLQMSDEITPLEILKGKKKIEYGLKTNNN